MFKKILVVDDETEIVKIITAYLKKENYHYDLAFDGKQALEKFRVFSPDLIILDLMMPKINGEEVCKEIRKTSDIPIIMLTAKTNESSIINGFEIGTDDYLQKPFSPKELMLRIRSILRRYEKGKVKLNVLSLQKKTDLTSNTNLVISLDLSHD
jgi:two-component system alkaline phosphatase synthesis response regulator PhoP